jgi:hypothetical protein
MYDSPFTPQVGCGTVLVGITPVQVCAPGSSPVVATSCRVRCLVAGYLTFTTPLSANATPTSGITATAPANNTPSVNTIGMGAGQTEVFSFPQNAWFVSSNAGGFEITAGEGV